MGEPAGGEGIERGYLGERGDREGELPELVATLGVRRLAHLRFGGRPEAGVGVAPDGVAAVSFALPGDVTETLVRKSRASQPCVPSAVLT